MGLVLLIVIWLITFISSYFFIAKTWWLPTGASSAAAGIDHHFNTTYILMGIVFVAAQVILGLFAWKYRERKSSTQATYSHGNNTLEIVWTVLTLILFVGLNLMSRDIWASERFAPAKRGRQVWRDEAGIDRSVGGRGERDRSGHDGRGIERRCRERNDVRAGQSRSGSDPARSRCDPQLFCSVDAVQARRGAWSCDPHALHSYYDWRL